MSRKRSTAYPGTDSNSKSFLAKKEFPLSDDRDALIVGYFSLLLDCHTAIVTLLPKEVGELLPSSPTVTMAEGNA